MKSNILVAFFLLLSALGWSQDLSIRGSVKEADTGFPIPGANVVVENSTNGTSTDIDGNFVLSNVPSGSTIVISYLGYVDVRSTVSGSEVLQIVMTSDAQTLEEVVVIGYGTQRRREVTGAVSVVNAEKIAEIRPIQAVQALQGTVAGVNVLQSSGAPGAGLAIRIRGISTNGNNTPTAIIDGYIGDINLLNPSDIESITVLKDAQAAIYGTIAANGIVLVTTKMGRKNSKTKFSYNTYTGFQETSRYLPLLNATEYALLLNESYANGGQPIPFPNVSELGKGTDWQREVFGNNAPIISHDLSISGGSDKIGYVISASHMDQEGIIGGNKSGFLRNTARLGLNADLTDKLKVQTNVTYTYLNRKSINEFGLGSVLFNAANAPPTLAPRDAEGNFTLIPSTTGLGNEVISPLAQVANTFNNYDLKKLNGTFGLTYELIEDLTVTARIGFNTSNSEGRSFSPEISYGGKVFDNPRSSVNQNAINDNDWSFDVFADYKKTFSEVHNTTFTLGTTMYKTFGNGLFATGFDVPGNSWQNADLDLANGTSTADNTGSYSYDDRLLSYFARVQYDYKGRYLLSGLIRRDMSSRFGPNHRVAYFPSATAGWIVSDEPFFGQSKIINFLKFRSSYGVLGSDLIDSNGYLSVLSGEATYVFNGELVNGTAPGQIVNPDLRWEEARKFNAGVDLQLFNNSVDITVDYFNDTRYNLLIPGLPVSGIVGIGAPGSAPPTVNAGSVKNYGLEFAINYGTNIGDDFKIDMNYNVTFIKNKVTEINNGTGYLETGAFSVGQPAISRMSLGQPLGYFYGYRTDGIFQNQAEVDAHPSQAALGAPASPGDIRYRDLNGDNVIDASDRTALGDPIPSATMGFNLSMKYHGFDLSMYSFANIGHDMVRNYERVLSDVNRLDYVLNRWTGEGTSNTVPRVTTQATGNNVFSDYFVEDASFVRIQKVELGYSLNPKFIERTGLSQVRIYTNVNNLYTFTKYKGFDPAASTGQPVGGGIDNGFYPVPRIFIIGASINF